MIVPGPERVAANRHPLPYVEEVEGEGLRVARRRTGSVVLAHGMWSDARVFGPMLDALGPGARPVAIDLPGHGRRADDPPARTVGALARELLRAGRGPEPAVLVGVSMGAIAALHAALLAPDAVAGLVLFAATPFAPSAARRLSYHALAGIYGAVGPVAPLRRGVEHVAFGSGRGATGPFARQAVQWATAVPRETVVESLRLMAERPSIVDRLPEITMPVAVVVGEQDRVFGPEPSRALARGIPRAGLTILPRTGHAAIVERPLMSAAVLEELLERLGRLRS